jgi:peptide deformylase
VSSVVDFDLTENIQEITRDLIDTMRANHLVGIAAPQIGVNLRIFVTEIRETPTRNTDETDPLRVYINPRIVSSSDESYLLWE